MPIDLTKLNDLIKLNDPDFVKLMSMSDKQRIYKDLYRIFDTYSQLAGFGDIFSYARSREVFMACELDHIIADNYSGADAYDKNGKKVEYKSTISSIIKATYNGISVLDTWPQQEKYLIEEKIGCYDHYWARFSKGSIVEMYQASGEQVLNVIVPKIKILYFKLKNVKRKDPRLGASISKSVIEKIAKRIK